MTMTASAEDFLKELVRAGVHIGHRKSRRHPSMMPFIYGIRGKTEIIDVTKTVEALDTATSFMKDRVAAGAMVLFVGTRPSNAEFIRATAKNLGMPYVTSRWIGGTITNFAVIGKRLDAFRKLAAQEASGELAEKYTKAERVRFQKELARFEKEVGGIRELTRVPDVLVLASLRADQLAAREARRRGIPVIAIADTDVDPRLADYSIPGNDDAISAVHFLIARIAAAVSEGKAMALAAAHVASASSQGVAAPGGEKESGAVVSVGGEAGETA